MQIVEKFINDITPYWNNPRRNEEAVVFVANSIKDFGFKVPIVVDENNVVICGHTRLKAAQKLGMAKVPCIVAKGLSEEQKRAYRLADNKLHELSTFDLDALEMEFNTIGSWDMAKYGFFQDDMEVEEMMENHEKKQQNREFFRVKIKCSSQGQADDLAEHLEAMGYSAKAVVL